MSFVTGIPIYARALVRTVYPENCPLCENRLKSWEIGICGDCSNTLETLASPQCPACSRSMPLFTRVQVCGECLGRKHWVERNWSLFAYNDSMKTLLHDIKFQGKRALLGLFQKSLSEFADSGELPGFDCLIPVPLDAKRLWERGFNQSEVLAWMLGRALKVAVRKDLRKSRITPPQSSLDRRRRLENLQGSFYVADPGRVKGNRVLLVDDIYTTGATADECARTLLASGARSVHCFTLARAGNSGESKA